MCCCIIESSKKSDDDGFVAKLVTQIIKNIQVCCVVLVYHFWITDMPVSCVLFVYESCECE